MKKNKVFPSWCCQECGEHIGWIGRFFQAIIPRYHKCPDPHLDEDNWGIG